MYYVQAIEPNHCEWLPLIILIRLNHFYLTVNNHLFLIYNLQNDKANKNDIIS